MAKAEGVEICGFCPIFMKQYKRYTGRNPRTGEPIKAKPEMLLFFKCGKKPKEKRLYTLK